MEVIRLQGYSEREKAEIARRYLWPRRLKEAGMQGSQVNLPRTRCLNLVISVTPVRPVCANSSRCWGG